MQEGPDGLAPSDGFLESAMAPRTVFNDNSEPSGECSISSYKSYISHESHIYIYTSLLYIYMPFEIDLQDDKHEFK